MTIFNTSQTMGLKPPKRLTLAIDIRDVLMMDTDLQQHQLNDALQHIIYQLVSRELDVDIRIVLLARNDQFLQTHPLFKAIFKLRNSNGTPNKVPLSLLISRLHDHIQKYKRVSLCEIPFYLTTEGEINCHQFRSFDPNYGACSPMHTLAISSDKTIITKTGSQGFITAHLTRNIFCPVDPMQNWRSAQGLFEIALNQLHANHHNWHISIFADPEHVFCDTGDNLALSYDFKRFLIHARRLDPALTLIFVSKCDRDRHIATAASTEIRNTLGIKDVGLARFEQLAATDYIRRHHATDAIFAFMDKDEAKLLSHCITIHPLQLAADITFIVNELETQLAALTQGAKSTARLLDSALGDSAENLSASPTLTRGPISASLESHDPGFGEKPHHVTFSPKPTETREYEINRTEQLGQRLLFRLLGNRRHPIQAPWTDDNIGVRAKRHSCPTALFSTPPGYAYPGDRVRGDLQTAAEAKRPIVQCDDSVLRSFGHYAY